MIIWLMGRPGSGKSSIAREFSLVNKKYFILDADIFRKSRKNGFDIKGRLQNIIDAVNYLQEIKGNNVICSFITPFEIMRKMIKEALPGCKIIYVKCSFEECKKRDPKNLYSLASQGILKNFTGIDSTFEEPESPDLILDTKKYSIEECVKKLNDYIR